MRLGSSWSIAQAMAALQALDYPGNIRELRNLIERAVILTDGDESAAEHLARDSPPFGKARPESEPFNRGAFVIREPVELAEVERLYLKWMESRSSIDRVALASTLGVAKRTLNRKLGALRKGKPEEG